MLTLAAPSGHRALRPYPGLGEGSGKGQPPCGERHVSDAPLRGRRAREGKLEETEEKPSCPPHPKHVSSQAWPTLQEAEPRRRPGLP